jgi:hypothetical protein
VALTGSRQFSGLVTLATRPLLLKELGAPPRNRTAHTEVATRPLATCCCGAWRPRGDSNTQSRVWNPLASPSATGASAGPRGRPGLRACFSQTWCSGRDSNSQQCGPRPHASTSCATRTLVGSQGFEPRRSQRDTASTARSFRPLSQLPEHELSKIWRKAGDSNAQVPRDPGLADQWDTNYPEPSGYELQFDLEGNYRLDERHQDCPTVSR